jgi:hypothetical protein
MEKLESIARKETQNNDMWAAQEMRRRKFEKEAAKKAQLAADFEAKHPVQPSNHSHQLRS